MTIWNVQGKEALILELDCPEIELIVSEHRAAWIDSLTGRVLRWVVMGQA